MKKELARACQGITCRLLATRTRTIEASPYTPPVVVVDRGCTVFIRFCLPGREESQGQRRLRMGARLVETNADGPCTANFGLDWIGAPQGTISLPRNPSPPASLSASVPLHACEGLAVRGALHALVCVPSSSILSAASPWHGGYASFDVRRSTFDVRRRLALLSSSSFRTELRGAQSGSAFVPHQQLNAKIRSPILRIVSHT